LSIRHSPENSPTYSLLRGRGCISVMALSPRPCLGPFPQALPGTIPLTHHLSWVNPRSVISWLGLRDPNGSKPKPRLAPPLCFWATSSFEGGCWYTHRAFSHHTWGFAVFGFGGDERGGGEIADTPVLLWGGGRSDSPGALSERPCPGAHPR